MKSALRKKLKSKRKGIADKSAKDRIIADKLIHCNEFISAEKILIFASLNDEVSTDCIIDYALSVNKTVALPKCSNGSMSFYTINSLSETKTGRFNIREPENNERLEDFEKSVIIVPALAFDKRGHRIGYGGGYYDRFLAEYHGISVGLCYEDLIIDCLPAEEHDMAVDKVITEKNIYGGENG